MSYDLFVMMEALLIQPNFFIQLSVLIQ